jgi:hypothetical protein
MYRKAIYYWYWMDKMMALQYDWRGNLDILVEKNVEENKNVFLHLAGQKNVATFSRNSK